MADIPGKIGMLEAKIRKLITLHVALKAETEVLKADNHKFTQSIHQQQEQLRRLEEENKTLKLARTLRSDSGESDLPEMKAKINEMIRDIDKCLALLNK